MTIGIDKELKQILKEIKNEQKSLLEWSEVESGDMYQSSSYCGGYDAEAFCFSYYDQNNKEYWFEFTLDDVEKMIQGEIKELNLISSK